MREVKSSKLSSPLTVLSMGVAAVLWSQAASAAPVEEVPNVTLQTITVTANSSVRDDLQKNSVDSAQYIPAGQASLLSDFLDGVPGASVGGTSAVNQRVRIRGLDDTNLKVTVDGARQEGYAFHHAGDLVIDPDLLKRSEVSVGNNSVTLGNNAIGGAVAFETVDAADLLDVDQKVGAKVHTGYASNNDELLTSATVFAAPTENVDLLAYYGKRTAGAGEDGAGRDIQTEDSDTESILLKAGTYLGDNHHVSGSFSRTENEGMYPNRADFPLTDENGWNPAVPWIQNRDTYTLEYAYQPANDLIDIKANIYQSEMELDKDNGYIEVDLVTKGGKIENTSRIASKLGSHKLITGVEYYTKESDTTFSGVFAGNDEAKNTSVYLEDQWQMGKLTLTPGVRYDRYEAPGEVTNDETYDNVVGAFAANYQVLPSTNVFASYTQLFNGPDLQEAIRNTDGADKYISSDLEPETGSNTEVGVSTIFRNLTIADDSLQLSGKYFVTDLENWISYESGLDCTTGLASDTGTCAGSFNADEDYEIKGVELSADYRTNNFNMGLSYARARSEGKETGYSLSQGTGDENDSGDKYMINLGYAPTDTLDLGWRSTYVTSINPNTGDDTDTEKEGYDVHDIFMTYTPQQLAGVKATLGVYNMFDETYANHSSRYSDDADYTDYAAGRNVKASLTYQF
ncbi:TonB-dependent receptor [Psychrobacter sp. SCQQ22]|uniref:TonB-dependent receptor domain-containing protein n=1 Tax=Psychrobacter sp. SCQQ22 TaxID=2792059 RepID=UPI0018CD6892|nr:TonB-dependent receptor [Psychrobacter sp. SCQQ22]MBH0085683.1 TonB-dependent receptor [Psychrobacter sp. SCQQ22]